MGYIRQRSRVCSALIQAATTKCGWMVSVDDAQFAVDLHAARDVMVGRGEEM